MSAFETEVPVTEDAGVKAAAVMRERSKRLQASLRLMQWVILSAFMLAVLVAGGLGYYVYTQRVTGFEQYERQCRVEVGKTTIVGTRTFHQPYAEYLGHRVVDTSKVLEKTTMGVKGYAYNVLAITGDESKVIKVGAGEQGIQILDKAEKYVFVVDGIPALTSYQALCSKSVAAP